MLPSRSLFQPYGRILLRDSRSGNFPGSIVTVAAPLSLVRFLKSTVLLALAIGRRAMPPSRRWQVRVIWTNSEYDPQAGQ